jgi:Uma2 family endonuclease
VELAMPSPEPEWLKGTLTQIVDAIAFARDLHYQNLASIALTRRDLDRGFEPDVCFYIQHATALQDIEHLDLTTDPPPDLVIEIDITNPSLNKLPLYAAIGVPEVWRYTRDGIRLYQLQRDQYELMTSSVVFPGIGCTDLELFIDQSRETTHRTAWFKDVVSRSQPPTE